MKIRLAARKDAKDVAAIIKKHSESDYMGYATFNEKYILEKMKKNNFFFVAIAKDAKHNDAPRASGSSASSVSERIVGCIRASIVDLDLAEIRQICVDGVYRKKGIATKLLDAALELLKKKKMRKVAARAKADNAPAIALFEKMGFEKEGYFREHYRKGVDIIQFGKFLK